MLRFFFSGESVLSPPHGVAPRFVVAADELVFVAERGRLADRVLSPEEIALVRAVVGKLLPNVQHADVISNQVVYRIYPLDPIPPRLPVPGSCPSS
jgi:hypothetical protein